MLYLECCVAKLHISGAQRKVTTGATWGRFKRSTSSINVAATEVHRYHSHYRGPLVYDHAFGLSQLPSTIYDAAIRSGGQSNRTPTKADQHRPWSTSRDHEGQQGKHLMSDRPVEQVPLGVSTANGNSSSQSTTTSAHPYIQRTTSNIASAFSPATQTLPPLPQALRATSESFSPAASRSSGFSAILNPLQSDDSQQVQKRKASELESPRSSGTALPSLVFGCSNRPQASGISTVSPVGFTGPERASRRLLTPRSPSLHRTASLGHINPTTGTISAQQSPFPPSPRAQTYAVESVVSGAPPLPTPPAAAGRLGYGFRAPTPSSEVARRASFGATRITRGPSPSASPSTSYSSFSQASPSTQYVPMSTESAAATYSGAVEAPIGEQGTAETLPNTTSQDRQRPVGIPISSSAGQNVYQMMTLETTSGTVQLPVNVQAASRVADEKRRRNAGASARFRQRRKEKEKEASSTISRLEQQVKELSEDLDFYKREREYLAGVVLQVPGGDRHFPRPTSPRPRRSSTAIAGPSSTSGSRYGPSQKEGHRSSEEGRNVRRTPTISLPPPPPPPPQSQSALPPPGASFPSSYGLQYAPPLAPQPMAPIQQSPGLNPSPHTRFGMAAPLPIAGGLMRQQSPPTLASQLMQAPPQTGPYNPYAPDRRQQGPPGPYRDR